MHNTEPRYFKSTFNNNGETAFGLGFYVLTEQFEDIYEYSLSIDDERRKNFCSESAI